MTPAARPAPHRAALTTNGAELVTDTPGVPRQHQPGQLRRASERTIPATCQDHGRCTLRVTCTADGGIVLNPHAGFSCVLTLGEAGGAGLRDALAGWLGREGTRLAGTAGPTPATTPTRAP